MKCDRLLLALALFSAAPLGCGDDGQQGDTQQDASAPVDSSAPLGSSTGAVCDDRLSYANDIKPIVETYCTRCHSSALNGADRMGAPADHNFDTESGILAQAAHIDENAGSGPRQTNVVMPPSAPKPSIEQRATLSKYLACHL